MLLKFRDWKLAGCWCGNQGPLDVHICLQTSSSSHNAYFWICKGHAWEHLPGCHDWDLTMYCILSYLLRQTLSFLSALLVAAQIGRSGASQALCQLSSQLHRETSQTKQDSKDQLVKWSTVIYCLKTESHQPQPYNFCLQENCQESILLLEAINQKPNLSPAHKSKLSGIHRFLGLSIKP